MSPLELTTFFVKTFFVCCGILAFSGGGYFIIHKALQEADMVENDSWRWRIAMLLFGITIVALIITGFGWMIATLGPPAAAR